MWACGIFLDQGTNPCSFPALEGGFLTIGLPRKSDCQPQNRASKEFKHISVITCKFYFKKLTLFFIMINSINTYIAILKVKYIYPCEQGLCFSLHKIKL